MGTPTRWLSRRTRRPRLAVRRLAVLVVMAALVAIAPLEEWLTPLPARAPVAARIFSGVAPKHSELGRPQRWHQRRLEVAVDSALATSLPGSREAIEEAFSAWRGDGPDGANTPRMRFVVHHGLGPARRDGQNTVTLAPIPLPGHENDLAVTVGYSDRFSGEIVEADIIVNARHRFIVNPAPPIAAASRPRSCIDARASLRCGDAYDLQNVLTHEAGHFLGLSEDRHDARTTMYFCTSACETHKRRLTRRDRVAMAALYADGYPEVHAGCQLRAPGL